MNVLNITGETARLSSFVGATAIGDLVKTTLGPKGMVLKQSESFIDKNMLVGQNLA